jgi:hypothetical protein
MAVVFIRGNRELTSFILRLQIAILLWGTTLLIVILSSWQNVQLDFMKGWPDYVIYSIFLFAFGFMFLLLVPAFFVSGWILNKNSKKDSGVNTNDAKPQE